MARYRTMWALALAVEMSSWSQAGVGDLLSGQWLRTKLERLGWHPIRPGKLRPAESIGARATRRVLAPERRGEYWRQSDEEAVTVPVSLRLTPAARLGPGPSLTPTSSIPRRGPGLEP